MYIYIYIKYLNISVLVEKGKLIEYVNESRSYHCKIVYKIYTYMNYIYNI